MPTVEDMLEKLKHFECAMEKYHGAVFCGFPEDELDDIESVVVLLREELVTDIEKLGKVK